MVYAYAQTYKCKIERIENVLNEDYELYLNQAGGFRDLKNGAGTGIYVGATIDW